MPGKKTSAKIGATGAMAMVRHPALRRATTRAARPTAKVGWRVGKVVVKRKARQQLDQLGSVAGAGASVARTGASVARTGAGLWVIYGLPAAQELGLIERPKPRRTGRVLVAGIVIGAAAVYFLEPEHGGEHRRRVQEMLG
jgi:hypothetical protein